MLYCLQIKTYSGFLTIKTSEGERVEYKTLEEATEGADSFAREHNRTIRIRRVADLNPDGN